MPPSNTPVISIVIPAYKAQRYIDRTLDSVITQDYNLWECIIINDCTPDNTMDVVAQYVNKDPRFKTVTTPHNMGAFGARNLGIDTIIGRYLCFLDADDVWHPKKLSTQLTFMKKTECDISCHAYNYIDENDTTIKGTVTPLPQFDIGSYMGNTCISMDTVMIDTHKTGPLKFRNAPKREDTQFWIDALSPPSPKTILGMDNILASYRIHGGQVSGNKLEMALRTLHLYLSQPHVTKSQALINWLRYMVNATQKRL